MCDPEKIKEYDRGGVDLQKAFVCDIDMMLGYSITSLKINNQTFVATGGPRANGIRGEIKLFHLKVEALAGKLNSILDAFEFKSALRGSVLNSGFGTTVAGADIDGDGIDELIVGEPYYTVISNFISSLQPVLNLVMLHRTI